jgi:hypothetical protein
MISREFKAKGKAIRWQCCKREISDALDGLRGRKEIIVNLGSPCYAFISAN